MEFNYTNLPLVVFLLEYTFFNTNGSAFELSASVSLKVCIVGKYESGCRKYILPVKYKEIIYISWIYFKLSTVTVLYCLLKEIERSYFIYVTCLRFIVNIYIIKTSEQELTERFL